MISKHSSHAQKHLGQTNLWSCLSSVMATLQLPANNLANLANLPPGTKLYLTTNSKNPSGKGKLLLIPQGAILRASSSAGNTHIHTYTKHIHTHTLNTHTY